MVTHIVIFRWISGVTEEQVDRLAHGLSALAADMRDIMSLKHGADLQFREGNGDYAVVATFDDRAGWDAYQGDPRHKALVRDLVMPIQASRLTIQF